MPFHDHGPAFRGPPDGQKCSVEKHTLLRDGLPPKDGLPVETEADRMARWKANTVEIASTIYCACCRYPLVWPLK